MQHVPRIIVVGGGVVGLAAAAAIARRGAEVSVLERHGGPGLETSTRGSGVIHAGLYYPAGSLKARLCVEGHDRLLSYCASAGVPHVRCGKLVVADGDGLPALERVAGLAAAAGATVEIVGEAFIRAREPHVHATHALWSPATGWLDAAEYVRALTSDVERHGGVIRTDSPLVAAHRAGDGIEVVTPSARMHADVLVNAAGLYSDEVSRLVGGEPFTIYPCRGEYAELALRARHLVNGLVYPVPLPSGHGLGVHFTPRPDGSVLVGPTVRYQQGKDDYETGRLRVEDFLEPARTLLPALTLRDLTLAGAGIRPKLSPPDQPFADFLIRRDALNPFVIHAAGIESPGLTASLAIGERVAEIVTGR